MSIDKYFPFTKVILLCVFYAAVLNAGTYKSSIRGIILEGDSDMPIENAVVRIDELGITDVTDDSGGFQFLNIDYGTYTVSVSHISYRAHKQKFVIDKDIVYGIIIHIYPRTIETSQIVVTGKHSNTGFEDLHEMTNVLKGKELERDMGSTLGASLKNETGLAIRTMGPAPARPVIRGLGGDRVLINEDGINTSDLSATSPDHAVAMEPFMVERIEVIRGPKILLNSSTTIGGIVNVIRNDIPSEIPESITGSAGLYGESANKGYLGAGSVQIPLNNFVIKGEITGRRTDNLTTPAGVLQNSHINTLSYNTGLSYGAPWGFSGVSLREFHSDYGIPGGFVGAHPNGVDIKMFKRQLNAKVNINTGGSSLPAVELNFGRDYYRHQEFESNGNIGSEFTIYHYQGGINLHTGKMGFLNNGTVGVSYEQRDFNIGGFVFTNPAVSRKASAFFYQNSLWGRFNFELGGRYSFDDITPEPVQNQSGSMDAASRNFNSFSASFSALYEISSVLFGGINVSSSSRVPTIEELYSRGPHLAAYSYETGNPLLDLERGIGTELFIYYKSPRLFSMVTFFRNDLSYYLIPRNTGRINYATLLPVYETSGVPALMQGVESRIAYSILSNLNLDVNISYTYGEIKDEKVPLPMIPPVKGFIDLRYTLPGITVGLTSELAARQNRVDLFETPTAGYFTLNSYLQYSLIAGGNVHNFSLSLDNILNKEYRNHLSRVKVIMPEAGRNARLTYRFYF